MRVTQVWRKPQGGQVSLERLYGWLNDDLAARGTPVAVLFAPFVSKGVIRRILNVAWVALKAPRGVHIVGDITYVALGLIGRRPVITILDAGRLHELHGIRRWVMKKIWFEWPMRIAAQVVFISREAMMDVGGLVSLESSKCRVIHCAVDPSLEPSTPPDGVLATPVCLQVGLKANKNARTVIRAVAEAGARLLVVGASDPETRAYADRHGCKVTFLGRVSDEGLQEAYRACDIVLFVSLSEGFGMPVIEAQRMMRPVVTSNIPVLREVAGDGAYMIHDPLDESEVAVAIGKIASDPTLRKELTLAGSANARRFSVSEIALKYRDLYVEMARG